ncbi:hypothetical protein Baya_5644 [Bagarius yarrelli]|uniref:Uncharacterized protein n=1 Tax=Bagarius yarrelli TaxID=175774 RepID=A0A556TW90_BAGYA|nr:hypothetical protein Baya_5644 [Bagarius yarrelli]
MTGQSLKGLPTEKSGGLVKCDSFLNKYDQYESESQTRTVGLNCEALWCYACVGKGCSVRREECGSLLQNPVCATVDARTLVEQVIGKDRRGGGEEGEREGDGEREGGGEKAIWGSSFVRAYLEPRRSGEKQHMEPIYTL